MYLASCARNPGSALHPRSGRIKIQSPLRNCGTHGDRTSCRNRFRYRTDVGNGPPWTFQPEDSLPSAIDGASTANPQRRSPRHLALFTSSPVCNTWWQCLLGLGGGVTARTSTKTQRRGLASGRTCGISLRRCCGVCCTVVACSVCTQISSVA